jgi:hypothetical protein
MLLVAQSAAAQNLTLGAGSYILGDHSTSTGMFNIRIEADYTTLDLNGKTVRCQPSNPGTAVTFGIYAPNRSHITIKNGTITGCMFGVHAGYSSYVTLENVNFTGNTYIGANLGSGGTGNIVRGSRFASITGYTDEAYAIGLNGIGHNSLVENNIFENLYKQPNTSTVGEGVGVLVEANATTVTIRNNTFTNANRMLNTIGVWVAQGSTATITGNMFTNWEFAIAAVGIVTVTNNTFQLTGVLDGSVAIYAATTSTASGNTITAYPEAFGGGITDGGNTITAATSAPPPSGRWFRFCVDSTATCYEGLLPPSGGL